MSKPTWKLLTPRRVPTSVSFFRMLLPVEDPIARNRNTYAKRQREQDKKYRADKKREKKDQKKVADPAVSDPAVTDLSVADPQPESVPREEAH
jgi:hypothetical protein